MIIIYKWHNLHCSLITGYRSTYMVFTRSVKCLPYQSVLCECFHTKNVDFLLCTYVQQHIFVVETVFFISLKSNFIIIIGIVCK